MELSAVLLRVTSVTSDEPRFRTSPVIPTEKIESVFCIGKVPGAQNTDFYCFILGERNAHILGEEMHAADRFFPKSKTTGDGFYRGSLLVTLAIRSNTTDKEIKQQGFDFIFIFFFAVLYPLYLSFCRFADAGRTGG